MGLDMYLYRKSYLPGNEEFIHPEHRTEVTVKIGGKKIDASKVKFITEEVGYWRKANQIHAWFVENVQNGVDDCGSYPVTVEQLLELKDLCAAALENKEASAEVLPTQSGFFFGSTDYDEYYYQDLNDTIAIIDEATKDLKSSWPEFEYHASW